ncbi:hypothetical protein Pan153_06700 [Gimesia panareensis]|uniref:Uncharacterized protein n=1 Tax=Gimesia panareensis TaxID=2527978 RepID=A0A518FI75_9PLAN|nr:hypothetical protein [Gimesia panareensis]QDV16049.1 hypothetical protein Pan153_06700 [Gimesia panareensis]
MRYFLFYNYHQLNQTWEMIPDEFWRKLLSEYFLPGDAVGFKGLSKLVEIEKYGLLEGVSLVPTGTIQYQPYCISGAVQDVENYKEQVLLFAWNQRMQSLLQQISLSELFPDNEYVPTDELVFTRGDQLLMTASNVDQHLCFYQLSYREKSMLESFDPGVWRGLIEA